MDRINYDLYNHFESEEHLCGICGEYNDKEWQCECCRECEREVCVCEDVDEITK